MEGIVVSIPRNNFDGEGLNSGPLKAVLAGVGAVFSHLELGIGPAGDLNDHVKNGLLLVCVQGNVVEGGDGNAILLDVDAVLQGVWRGHLAHGIRRSHWVWVM